MAGFENQVLLAKNVNFDHLSSPPHNGIVTANGQLLIGSTADPNIAIVANTLTAGTGINITNGPGSITIASTASLTDLHTARFIVASSTAGTGANFTTITSAIAAAQGTGINSTIFVQPGTYTENFTLPANINLVAYDADGLTPNVTIVGNITCTDAGTRSISGIRLQTNSAAFLTVSGSAATIVNLDSCYLNCSNNMGITFSSSSATAAINMNYCMGNIETTGISLFAHSSAGVLNLNYCLISNSGSTTTASTCSAGNLILRSTEIVFPITTSETGVITANRSIFNTNAVNTTALTCGGGVSFIILSEFSSGTASAISVGGTLGLHSCTINSSNTNAITGAGTLGYSGLIFAGISYKINTTNQTGGTIQGGRTQAPAAGFLGERIESTATAVAITSSTPKTVTSITLTPGVWDIEAIAATTATGGTELAQAFVTNISTADNTLTGTLGIEYFQINQAGSGSNFSGVVPSYRVTITSNTTYYLVCFVVYTSTTSPTNGRISATRVG